MVDPPGDHRSLREAQYLNIRESPAHSSLQRSRTPLIERMPFVHGGQGSPLPSYVRFHGAHGQRSRAERSGEPKNPGGERSGDSQEPGLFGGP